MIIRAALHGDIEAVVQMGARMHEESAYSFLPFDRDEVRRLFLSYVTDRRNYGGFVADDAGKLAGMIGGFISSSFFCDEKVACDMVLFVCPSYRGGRTALRLIKAFQHGPPKKAVERCA